MKSKILLFIFSLSYLFSFSTEYYVAPNGNDANAGTKTSPVLTIQKAQALANSGDIVYIRGGNYTLREKQIAEYNKIWAYVTKLDKNNISYLAYANETPVFNFENIKPENHRVIAFLVRGDNIKIKGIEVVGVQVTIKTHTQSECFEIQGNNNTLEQLKMHDGMAIGVYIIRGSNNLVLNCDAYRNWDSVSENGKGGNTDGFGCHTPPGDKNNVFRGCRAWFNSDDGFDLISNAEPVLIDNCWAFYNGYTSDFTKRADGNGFKCGGYASWPFDRLPNPIPRNTIQFSLAVGNKQGGFYSNHHLNGNNWYNNTAYKNRVNYDMLNRKEQKPEEYLQDCPGWGHILTNNLGYGAIVKELVNTNKPECTLKTNYFDLNVPIKESDFISLDESFLTAPRQADGSLPKTDFLRLSPSSPIIDAGTDIGFPFKGKAPDLGCFEKN